MLAIILTNLRRRLTRTILTAAGIAVGVATIVALLSFTQGLRESAAGFVHLGGSELGVFQADTADPATSVLPESIVGRLKRLPQVADATPLLLIVEGVEREPSAVVFGARPGDFFARQLVIVNGKQLEGTAAATTSSSDGGSRNGGVGGGSSSSGSSGGGGSSSSSNGGVGSGSGSNGGVGSGSGRGGSSSGSGSSSEILVGDRLASQLGLAPGDALTVKGHRYAIAGVYHSGILFEDSGAVLDLSEAQSLLERPGEATNAIVRLAAGARADIAAKTIERALPGTQAITTAQQALRAGANGTLIAKAVLAIVAIAIVVGVIGVANTMAMAIAERRAELGLLSTVGWSPVRVAGLILGEGVAVSILGAAAGLLLGVIGGGLLVRALGVSSYVSPSVTAWGLGRGLLVGVAIGVLGGIYPAWRVTRMTPLKALSGT